MPQTQDYISFIDYNLQTMLQALPKGMTGTLVALTDVSLGYGRAAVLEHVSFDVERGEFLALLGPNGAGKTTLLRGMLGLVPAAGGADRLRTSTAPPARPATSRSATASIRSSR